MREILFKAKRLDNGEWITGYYALMHGYHYIMPKDDYSIWYEVNQDTICQYTGLTDKNGNKIWENDICNALLAPTRKGFKDEKEKCVVKYGIREENFKIELGFWLEWMKTDYWRTDIGFWTENRELEVIGNIFDNPELLKGGSE